MASFLGTGLAAPTEAHVVTITYLRQEDRPVRPDLPMPAGRLAIMRAEQCPLAFYRYLFDVVGGPHRWVSRRYMTDTELAERIHDEGTHILVLYRSGAPVGFGEIDRPDAQTAQIRFFGLCEEAQGLGLGRWFFREVCDVAWGLGPKALTIETCSLDSPRALTLYQREGFTPTGQAEGLIEWRG